MLSKEFVDPRLALSLSSSGEMQLFKYPVQMSFVFIYYTHLLSVGLHHQFNNKEIVSTKTLHFVQKGHSQVDWQCVFAV